MEHSAGVTTVSWIPSESIEDAPLLRAPFELGLTHYDTPPPDDIGPGTTLEQLAADDVFRFAHRLSGVIEVDDGRVTAARYDGSSRGVMGGTTVRVGGWSTRLAGLELDLLREEPTVTDTTATFRQTFGGRTGLPAPRRVQGHPFARVAAPVVWTTMALTLHADGRAEFALAGASAFPRHWLYGPDGSLTAKSGATRFLQWYRGSHGTHTPWGDEDAPAVVAQAESALERRLASTIMRGGERPEVRRMRKGDVVIEQGSPAGPVYLLLDGLLAVEVDGTEVGVLGPGAVVGERAHVEGDARTATLRARTGVRLAVARPEQLDPVALAELTALHRREERQPPG
ncbi:hypothetical protein GCM10023168_25760 [Fodinibacter luteus]|uniref:Cyclic nucleotide-binding domain-containing protein n=1 Tax=Fodinibacter luteus TaxID=552064 RepID=A0ABP8KKB0_9MICO